MATKFAAFQSVKIVDKEYERFGQVGTYVGLGEVEGEVSIKFDDGTDTFPADAVEGL